MACIIFSMSLYAAGAWPFNKRIVELRRPDAPRLFISGSGDHLSSDVHLNFRRTQGSLAVK
jgi:hypothetical protein